MTNDDNARVLELEDALREIYEIASRTGEYRAWHKYPGICRSGRGLAMELFPIINKALGRPDEVSR